jgi:pimeloyl-ACP methyl ester carboxylesterase
VSLLILSACTGSKSEVEMGESDDNRSETTMHETTLEVATDIAVGYTDRGDGPPVLLIHAGVFADWFVPMATEPVLDRFRVVRLRRAGYLEGRRPGHHVTLADHAAHAAAVADELGMRDAVVVGHSSGALIALELAAARPDIVASLVLFEPAPGGALAPDAVRMGIAEALNGLDVEARYDAFMAGAPDHRDVVRAALGDDGLARAIEESRWFFDDEVTAVGEWSFDATRASSIHQPTTVIAGSNPMYRDIARRLASWLPRSTTITLDHADHLLPLRQPDVLAHLVADAVGACEVDRCPTE